jgi:hypothetical protein
MIGTEDTQAKDIKKITNKIIAENSPNLEKEIIIQVKENFRTSNRQDQKRISSQHIILLTVGIWNNERMVKTARAKCQVTHNGQPIQ